MDADFEKIRRENLTVYIRRQLLNSSFGQAILSGEEKLREQYKLETVPSSDFTSVYRFKVNINGVTREVYLKIFLCRRRFDFIKNVFQGSRARRAFEAELVMAKNNFDVPEAIAMVEQKAWFFHTKSFFMTFGVEDSKSFFQSLCELREHLTQEQLSGWREMIRAFGRTIGSMHACNIFHGDLRLNNVLLGQEGDNHRFFFVDNERTKKFKRIPLRCRVKNLVQVNIVPPDIVSRTDRMRFFRAYCAHTGIGKEEGKSLTATILRKTRQRLEKRKRRHEN